MAKWKEKILNADWCLICLYFVVFLAVVTACICITQGLRCHFTAKSYYCIENGVCVHYTVHDDCWFHDGVRCEGEYTFVLEDNQYFYYDDNGWKVEFQPLQ